MSNIKIEKKWTIDCSTNNRSEHHNKNYKRNCRKNYTKNHITNHKKNQNENNDNIKCVKMCFRKLYTTETHTKDERKINVWRNVKDKHGNSYVYNIISRKSFWKVPKKIVTNPVKSKHEAVQIYKNVVRNSLSSKQFQTRVSLQKFEYIVESVA